MKARLNWPTFADPSIGALPSHQRSREQDRVRQIADVLEQKLPEFAEQVHKHRADWDDDPLVYLLVGALWRFAKELPEGCERALRAQRVYAVTDRMLVDGDPSVRDCFAIEMIEPLIDPASKERCSNLEVALGPAGQKALAGMRAWSLCYHEMSEVIRQLNIEAGKIVFTGVGVSTIDCVMRVVVDRREWDAIPNAKRDEFFRRLRLRWEAVSGFKVGVEITDTRGSGLEILRK